jgi:glucosamine-6-phosphate deaminase
MADDWRYDLAAFISFRDREACERVRAISRSELTRHPSPDFRIEVVDEGDSFYRAFAEDIVGRIRLARDEGRPFVGIFPVGPMPQYAIAARMINEERLSLAHVHTFNMDEYANEDGVTAPLSWPGSFQRAMWERFFDLVDRDLRPPEAQIHFPTA